MKEINILPVFLIMLMSCNPGKNESSCTCSDEFLFAKAYLEENYAGFSDKVKAGNRKEYEAHSDEYLQLSKVAETVLQCQSVIAGWSSFFRDGHVQIHFTVDLPDEYDEDQKRSILEQTERIKLNEKAIGKNKIEGIYYTADSSYKMAIMQSATSFRDYAGVILDAKSDWWEEGMVKAEFKELDENKFLVTNYNLYHHPRMREVTFTAEGTSDGLWFREGFVNPDASDLDTIVSAKRISSSTMYVRLGSFEDYVAPIIDSVFTAIADDLSASDYLILDIRGNGGGSDYTYQPVLPWICTDTMRSVGVDVLATAGNIKAWENMFADYPDIPEKMQAKINELIEKMKDSEGQLVNLVDDSETVMDEVKAKPAKIVVLIDGEVASSGEQFVLDAMESSKVTIMGHPTAGILDYANVRRKDLNCMPIELFYATTRSRRVDMGKGVDETGILPHITLSTSEDWVEAAVQYLEKNGN